MTAGLASQDHLRSERTDAVLQCPKALETQRVIVVGLDDAPEAEAGTALPALGTGVGIPNESVLGDVMHDEPFRRTR